MELPLVAAACCWFPPEVAVGLAEEVARTKAVELFLPSLVVQDPADCSSHMGLELPEESLVEAHSRPVHSPQQVQRKSPDSGFI